MTDYFNFKKIKDLPRIPLTGNIDLTYRCNNDCRHCWLRIPPPASEKEDEASLEEIILIVDEARAMGCRHWRISGGEPMLRPDFAELFDYISSKSVTYTLNTNGTLISPAIAKRLKRKGTKMVALYGATVDVHDHITRTPDSFDACLQGIAYLKEANAGFIVQIIPMKANYHQFNEMIKLAEWLSPHWRIGASWLYLSASGDLDANMEIARQRLDPSEVIKLDSPDLFSKDGTNEDDNSYNTIHCGDDNPLFAACIANRREFHVDPYSKMTFCQYIKDPAFRYDLRGGNFRYCWEEFIPSLKEKVVGSKEYMENCYSCDYKNDCRWCPVYGYLEHRRFSARVEYLCAVAKENRRFKDSWKKKVRYYQIAGITIQVESELPITDTTFKSKFKQFEVDGPGEDTIYVRHHFSLTGLDMRDLGEKVYQKPPWAIYRKGAVWIYTGISNDAGDTHIHQVAVCNKDHSRNTIYNDGETHFRNGLLSTLTLLPTDQIILARVLADRQSCYLHASGVIFKGFGLLFAGHSGAGKTTVATSFNNKAEILCDDRMIIRKLPEGFRIFGTWSHGDLAVVSAQSAPLRAILFLKQAEENRLIPLEDKKVAVKYLLALLIKPLVTANWWEKMLTLVENIVREVPCYVLSFKKDAQLVDQLKNL
ncbi:radical SAM protein [Thermodesulfobacteriota bacterium]